MSFRLPLATPCSFLKAEARAIEAELTCEAQGKIRAKDSAGGEAKRHRGRPE